jgi:GNAT superfamily N-acetyltransferase
MILIQRAGPEDAEALAQIRIQFLREVGVLDQEAQEASLLRATRDYFDRTLPAGEFVAFVAEREGRVVGTSGLIIWQRSPSPDNLRGREGYVLNMWTDPAHRGQGIGSALIRELIAFAREAELGRLRLHATPAARTLYQRFGFLESASSMALGLSA